MPDLAQLQLRIQSLEVAEAAARLENAAIKARLFDRSANRLSNTGSRLTRTFRRVVNTLGPLVGILGAFGAVRAAGATLADFGESMAIVRGIAIDTTETLAVQEQQFIALTDAARELGATTIFTANQVAQSELFLARAGFETQEILTALPATLNLAAAGVIDLGRAADIVTNTLSQFNLEANEIGKAGDIIVKTANSSNTSVLQLAEALKFGGPLAGALGIQLSEASAALGIFGNAGIQASLAGTQLRGIFSALLDPSKEAIVVLDQLAARLGTTREVFDITQNTLVDVFGAFRDASTSAEEFVKVFQRRQSAGALILARDVDQLAKLADEVERATGESERLAQIQRETLKGSFLALKSAVEGLVLSLGEAGLVGALQTVVDFSTSTIRAFTGFQDQVDRFKISATALAAVLRGLAGVLAVVAAVKFAGFLTSLVTGGSAALALFGKLNILMAGLSGPLGIAAVAVAGLTAALTVIVPAIANASSELDELGESAVNASFRVSELQKATKEYEEAVNSQDFTAQQQALQRQTQILVQTTKDIREGVAGLAESGSIRLSDIVDLAPGLDEAELSRTLKDQLLRSFERGVADFGAEAAAANILRSSNLPEDIREQFSQLARLAEQAAKAGTSFQVGGSPIDEFIRNLIMAEETEVTATANQTIRILNQEIDRIRRSFDVAELNAERATDIDVPVPIDPEQVAKATDSLNDFIEAQRREAELLGLTANEREVANAQRAVQDLLTEGAIAGNRNLLRTIREVIEARQEATAAIEAERAAQEEALRVRERAFTTIEEQLALLEREANLLSVSAEDRDRVRESLDFQRVALDAFNGSQDKAAAAAAQFREAIEALDRAAFLEDLGNRLGSEITPTIREMVFEVRNAEDALRALDQLALRISQTLLDAFVAAPIQEFAQNALGDVLGAGDAQAKAQAELAALQASTSAASSVLSGAGNTAGSALLSGAQGAAQALITAAQSAAATLRTASAGLPGIGGARKGGFRGLGVTEARSLIASGFLKGAIRGAVLNSPTMVASNMVAGEGPKPEAVIPLAKNSSGELGISGVGFGREQTIINNNNVTLNVETQDAESFGNSESQLIGIGRRRLRQGT